MKWTRPSWVIVLGFAVSVCCVACGDDSPTGPQDDAPVVADYVIKLRSIDPRAGSIVSPEDVIVADLRYSAPDSFWGAPADSLDFTIHIMFNSTEEGRWVSFGEDNRVDLATRSGRLTFTYPLNQIIWNHWRLEHPLTARFSLVAWNRRGDGIVVESTEDIPYKE